jgi:methyl-accepting chemotaxis protein PixJ
MREALVTGCTVPAEPRSHAQWNGTLAMPLRVRAKTVGVLGFRKADGASMWTPQEVELLQLLVTRLGDALVGAQLYEAAQSDAARQQVVGELASKMRQTLDVEAVLRTAAQEMREALGLPEVVVRLRTPTSAGVDSLAQPGGKLRG